MGLKKTGVFDNQDLPAGQKRGGKKRVAQRGDILMLPFYDKKVEITGSCIGKQRIYNPVERILNLKLLFPVEKKAGRNRFPAADFGKNILEGMPLDSIFLVTSHKGGVPNFFCYTITYRWM
jgi:hypothetical protein